MKIIKTYQKDLVKALPTLKFRKLGKEDTTSLQQLDNVDTILTEIDEKLSKLKKAQERNLK